MSQNKGLTNLKLDEQEQRLEKALEKDEFVGVPDLKETGKFFKEAAKNYQELQKSKRITIRVNIEDLLKVRAKAKRHNIPYQTLLNALIHQYAEGQARVEL